MRSSRPGRDDLVVGEHDAGAARERMLGDDVDRGRLDLDEVRVGVDAPRARPRARSRPREVARHVDDVRVEMLGRRVPGREDGDARPSSGSTGAAAGA